MFCVKCSNQEGHPDCNPSPTQHSPSNASCFVDVSIILIYFQVLGQRQSQTSPTLFRNSLTHENQSSIKDEPMLLIEQAQVGMCFFPDFPHTDL